MPCWFFDRKEIRNSPTYQEGIDQATENRYRREGARLILDAGTKLGLRYDTCATGVVYFHRFYMFHSFREFHRYVMAGCCLFLAGKVEETPKKCKDIIRTVQTLLNPEAFASFGEDPREEVMTMERILLQTIKFDLQVEHPYSFLLSYAKQIKGDKDKIQKMAQMSWTFINDSLCTTLSLQWEPEIIAVSLMYLASRLTKFDPTDWVGRVAGSKSRWWEDLIEGMSMELMEDICHQVLDLYSAQQQAQKQQGEAREVSPPMNSAAVPRSATPRVAGPRDTPPPPPKDPPPPPRKQKLSPADSLTGSKAKKMKTRERGEDVSQKQPSAVITVTESAPSSRTTSPNLKLGHSNNSGGGAGAGTGTRTAAAPVNPYVSSSMYSSSFMSQEGQQSIQSLLGGTPSSGGGGGSKHPPPPQQQYPAYPPPPSTPTGGYPPPPAAGPYTPGGYAGGGYPPAGGQYGGAPPYSGSYSAQPYGQGMASSAAASTTTMASSYQPSAPYSAAPPGIPPPVQGYAPYPAPGYPPPMSQPPPAGPPPPFPPPPGFRPPPPGTYNTPPPMVPHRGGGGRPNRSNLAPVRHVSDRGGMR